MKDAIKAKPKEPAPYLQLSFIYAKYLKKTEQALKYANQAVALDPKNFDAYQRLYEIEMTGGDPDKAVQALERAAGVKSDDPAFLDQAGQALRLDGFQGGSGTDAGGYQTRQRFFQKGRRECGR